MPTAPSAPPYKRCPRCGAVTFYAERQGLQASFHVIAQGQIVPAAGPGELFITVPSVFHCISCSWSGGVDDLLAPEA